MSSGQFGIQTGDVDRVRSAAQPKKSGPKMTDCLLAVAALVCAGMAYRGLSSHLDNLVASPIVLPRAMKLLPRQLADWRGNDLSIPATTQSYMQKNFADDYISRRYIKGAGETWADLYVVYCSSRPGGILGHRPRVCYPGHGWVHDSTVKSQFISAGGRRIPCLIHEFHKPMPALDQAVVMNFYVVNGKTTTQEDDFSGAGWRRPNIAGDPARYVAQIQISSATENGVRLLARDATDHVLDFLPDAGGGAVVDADSAPGASL